MLASGSKQQGNNFGHWDRTCRLLHAHGMSDSTERGWMQTAWLQVVNAWKRYKILHGIGKWKTVKIARIIAPATGNWNILQYWFLQTTPEM